jgi:uncharacterized protein DUF6174
MFDSAADDEAADEARSSSQRTLATDSTLRRFVVWTLIGVGLGVIVILLVVRQLQRDPTPSLTPELFYAAHERWQANPLSNYDLEVRVTGPQAAVYRATVRNGEPQAATRNGQALNSRRTFGTWSVPGMFNTISRDIEAMERAAANGTAPPLILRAEFDSKYGYPAHYRRIDNGSRKGGDSIAVTWDVTEFRVVEPKGATEQQPLVRE